MEADSLDHAKWDYAEVEYIARDYAAGVGADYDERRPLAFIGGGAGKRALDGLGLTAKQIHPFSGFEYATVTGWFRAGREPSGTTFKSGIFPTLCEAYVRLHEQEPRHQAARDAYVRHGTMDDDYRLGVERKIATLLCTGVLTTREERLRERKEDLEAYHRAILHFASCYLVGDELHTLAKVALSTLNAHAARPARAAGTDRLDDIMGRTRWYWHADRKDDLEALFADADPEQSALFADAGMHIATTFIEGCALEGFLGSLSDDDLASLEGCIRRTMLRRGLV